MVQDFANTMVEIASDWVHWLVGLPRRWRRSAHFMWTGVKVPWGSYISANSQIGRRTRINAACFLDRCTIGSYCAIAGRLVVRGADHHKQYLNMQGYAQRRVIKSKEKVAGITKGNVRIGHGVWIGDSVIILAGAEIGNGAVIGAGSVVTRSIPPYAIAAGVPARVLRHRFPLENMELLKSIEWWNWNGDQLRRNRWIFEQDFSVPLGADLAARVRTLANDHR